MLIKKYLKNNFLMKNFFFILLINNFNLISSEVSEEEMSNLSTIVKMHKDNNKQIFFLSPVNFFKNALFFGWLWKFKTIASNIKSFEDKKSYDDLISISLVIFGIIGILNFISNAQNQNVSQETNRLFSKENNGQTRIDSVKKFLPITLIVVSLIVNIFTLGNKKDKFVSNQMGLLLLGAPLIFFLDLNFSYSVFANFSFSFLFILLNVNRFEIVTDNIDLTMTQRNQQTFSNLYWYLFYFYMVIKIYQVAKFFTPDKYFNKIHLIFLLGYAWVNLYKNGYLKSMKDPKQPYQLEKNSIIPYIYCIYLNILFISIITNYYCNKNQLFINFTTTVSKNILNYRSLYETLKTNIVLENINFLMIFLVNNIQNELIKKFENKSTNNLLPSLYRSLNYMLSLMKTVLNMVNYIIFSIIPIIGFNIYLISSLFRSKEQDQSVQKILKSLNLKNFHWNNELSAKLIKNNLIFLGFEGLFILLNLMFTSYSKTIFNMNHMNFFILFYLLLFQRDHLINEFNFEKLRSSTVELRKGKKNAQELKEELKLFEKALYFAYEKQETEDMMKILIPIIEKDQNTN